MLKRIGLSDMSRTELENSNSEIVGFIVSSSEEFAKKSRKLSKF